MDNLLLVLFTSSLISCNISNNESEKEEKSIISEYRFPNSNYGIQEIENNSTESFAFAFTNAEEFNIGDTLKAKIFLANRHLVYNNDSIQPIIKFAVGTNNLNEFGSPVKVINDTGYVKFVVKDFILNTDSIKVKQWSARITIPLKEMDTTFVIRSESLVVN